MPPNSRKPPNKVISIRVSFYLSFRPHFSGSFPQIAREGGEKKKSDTKLKIIVIEPSNPPTPTPNTTNK